MVMKFMEGCLPITTNICICVTKNKNMKATNLGIWYQQIPSGIIVNPLGEIIEPKVHNGSKFIIKNRVRFPISKLPKLNYSEAMIFKEIFC
jgi:hypothetical protein